MADDAEELNCPDCPPPEECPEGIPAWMATFADLVTLLLTFFVLLLSFAKTESAKYEAALGSIRNAFGGNVLQKGEVLKPGKSPDDQPTMIDAQLGNAVRLKEVFGRYIVHCKAAISESCNMEGMKVVLDCAHGAGNQDLQLHNSGCDFAV